MNGKTHVAFGMTMAASHVVLNWNNPMFLGMVQYNHPAVLVGAYVGSLLPDIDHQQAKLGKKFPAISKRLVHRGFTHSSAFLALLTLPFQMMAELPGTLPIKLINGLLVGLWLGVLSHDVADLFNHAGIAVMWPLIGKEKTCIAGIKTAGYDKKCRSKIGALLAKVDNHLDEWLFKGFGIGGIIIHTILVLSGKTI